MTLVTYEQAKAHLNLSSDEQEQDVRFKMDQATALVITHIKRPSHGWTEFTDPGSDLDFAIVQAAILMVLGDLFRHRGDEDEDPRFDASESGVFLKPQVRRLLVPLRDPALA